MFAELKKEVRGIEFEIEVSYCEPEQGPLLEENDETKIEDDFMNSLISSELAEEYLVDEKYDVFISNDLCVTTGNEEHLGDVFKQVDEEMKHRMDVLKNKTKTRALTKEDVHYCELEYEAIFEYDGA